MTLILAVLAIGLGMFALYVVAMLAIFPYLWFQDYLEAEDTRENNRKQMLGEDFLLKQKAKIKHPRANALLQPVVTFLFTWAPFIIVEILWLRTVWHLVMDTIYPRILDIFPF